MMGYIILDKESSMTSRRAGGRIAHMFDAASFGHIGTLDPMASGVLPIVLGPATKMIPFVESMPDADVKEYLFSMQFGRVTDTLDVTGRIIDENNITPDVDSVCATLPSFIGDIDQVPPAYSAVHTGGVRAYELARAGKNVQIPPRRVHIDALEFIGVRDESWHFRVRCRRGTYVRALARDIAQKCGAIATVDMIRRTKTGPFDIKNAVTLDFLENLVNNGTDIRPYLMPADYGLGDIPVHNLDRAAAQLYANGGFIPTDACDGIRRVYSGDDFIGIGYVLNKMLRPKRTI